MADYPGFVIPTRQKTDLLFSTGRPLGAAKSFRSPVAEVAGYNAVAFLGVSDQPFTVTVFEACSPDGPFVGVATLASALVGGQNQVCSRVSPCGSFMKVTLDNGGAAMGSLSFCSQGIPVP